MDSITQIVLGAAVGEVAMGKKAGNRAMLWGGIAGTIPDLDILANLFCDDLTALAFHRGISHSFFFAFTAPMLFAYLTERFYKSGFYQNKIYKYTAVAIWVALIGFILYGINYIPYSSSGSPNFYMVGGSIFAILGIAYLFWSKYLSKRLMDVDLTWKNWYWLFFWAIFTHPLLDSCTTYGTQLFQPFSDYRVGFNNISVADPVYTVPFAICLLIARFMTRGSKWRSYVNWAGIIISSAYLVFTVFNKFKVNRVFEKSLARDGIEYSRYTTTPTILNNLLWTGTAEGDTAYYHGMYSLLDKKEEVLKFNVIPKNYHLLEGREDTRAVQVLSWFSNGYYNVIPYNGDTIQLNDLRFGTQSIEYTGRPEDFIFGFILNYKDGEFEVQENRAAREGDAGQMFSDLWERMMGI